MHFHSYCPIIVLLFKVLGPIETPSKGSGRPKQTFTRSVRNSSLIKVNNNDNYCLFYAIVLTTLYVLANTDAEKKHIERLINSNSRRAMQEKLRYVKIMLREIRAKGLGHIEENLEEYDVEEIIPIIDLYYRRKYGENTFRFVVYDKYANTSPIYKREDQCKHTIGIWDQGGHYHGIRNINTFMAAPKYFCIDCERNYNKRSDHTAKCKAKCTKCCGIGVGHPCAPVPDFEMKCDGCLKTFYNAECYRRHIEKRVCDKFKLCGECGITYSTRKEHICYAKRCNKCKGYHRITGKCYVQEHKPRQKEHYRIITYDFETTQDDQYDGGGRLHRVNAVSAHVFCTQCIKNGTWNDDYTENCRICGPASRRK